MARAVAETDEDLAERLATDPERAVPPLVARYWRPAYGLAFQITRDRGRAEDAAQEAFARLLRAGGRYRAGRAFRPWFFRIVANCARDDRKAGARRRRHEERAARPLRAEPAAGGLDPDAAALLRAGLADLRPEQRAALTLHYLEDLTLREVAEVEGCPEGTAASRVRRGLKALRRQLPEALATASAAPTALLAEALRVEAPPAPGLAALRGGAVAAAAAPAAAGSWGLLAALVGLGALGALGLGVVLGPDDGPGSAAGPAPAAPTSAVATVASSHRGAGGGPATRAREPGAGDAAAAPPGAGEAEADALAAADAGEAAAREAVVVRVTRGGRPLAGVEVRCVARRAEDGQRGERRVFATDDAGEARCALGPRLWEIRLGPPSGADVPPGGHAPVVVAGATEPRPVGGVLLPLGPRARPGFDHLNGGAALALLEPGAREVDLVVPPLDVVAGQVVAARGGGPLPGARIEVRDLDAVADGDGRFAVLVAAADLEGDVRVSAKLPGYAYGGATVASGEDPRDVEVRLREGVDLRVRVLTADGEPAAGWTVNLGSPEGLQAQARTGPDGRFVFRDLGPNRGRGFALVYVKVLEPTPGGLHYEADLLARSDHEHVIRVPRRHALRGRTLAGGQLVDARVEVVRPARSDGGLLQAALRGETSEPELGPGDTFAFEDEPGGAAPAFPGLPGAEPGAFVLTDAPPGSVWVRARADGYAVAVREVTVPRDGELTIELVAPAETPVTVRHPDGSPAAGAVVRAVPAGALAGADRSAERPPPAVELEAAVTDAEGGVVLDRLADGLEGALLCELVDGRWVGATVTGGRPVEVVVPGPPVDEPAWLRYAARDPAGRETSFSTLRVAPTAAPERELLTGSEGDVLSFPEEEDPRGTPVAGAGEVWIEVTELGARAVRRARLAPGEVTDLGEVALEPLLELPVRVRFDVGAVNVQALEVRWRDPETGLPMRDAFENTLAPGEARPLRVPAGRLTLRPRWRSSREGPWRDLPAVEVDVDPAGPRPVELSVP